jgi:ABC-type Mn2+/Zn2+ transport system ATPase subunit
LQEQSKSCRESLTAWKELPAISEADLGQNCGPECDLCHSPVLEIKDLTVAYGRNLALQSVDMALAPRQLIGLLGPNGAGKSTLLKAILGMVAFSGQVTVVGRPATQSRDRLAYVPQKEDVRWDFPVTVEDVVMMGRYRHIGWLRRPSRQDKELVMTSLEMVGMADFKRRQISQLSGGQQQRVFVARALAQQGDIILLDEPLTGIDSTSQEVILNLLLRLRDEGKLIIMATHDLPTAAQICNASALINRRVVAFGPGRTVFQPELLAEAFGGKVLTFGGDNATTLWLN